MITESRRGSRGVAEGEERRKEHGREKRGRETGRGRGIREGKRERGEEEDEKSVRGIEKDPTREEERSRWRTGVGRRGDRK